LGRSTNYEAPHCATSSVPLLRLSSLVQIFFSGLKEVYSATSYVNEAINATEVKIIKAADKTTFVTKYCIAILLLTGDIVQTS
jgi:hypothetical protein